MSITPDGWLSWAEREPGPVEKQYTQPCTSEIYIPHSMVGKLVGWYSRLFDMSRLPNGEFTKNAAASVTGSILLDGCVIQHYPFHVSCWASGNDEANTRGNSFENESQYTAGAPDEGKPLTDPQVQSNVRIINEMAMHFDWEPHRPDFDRDPATTLLEHNEAVLWWGGHPTACPSGRMQNLWEQIEREDVEMQPYLAWDLDRQRIYYIGPWGASWITDASDVEALKERHGEVKIVLHKSTIESIRNGQRMLA